MAVKSALLGTRHPRKEKEAALQNKIVEPACLCGEISCATQPEMVRRIILNMRVRCSQTGAVAAPPGFAKPVAGCLEIMSKKD